MSQDVLSDVFQTLRVVSALYGRFEARAPWEVFVHATEMVRFYAVLEGRCRVEVPKLAPFELGPGDLAVLPHGSQHALYAGTESSSSAVKASYHQSVLEAQGFSLDEHALGGGVGGVRLVSGRIAFEQSSHHHFWPLLPPLMSLRGRSHVLPWLESTLCFIASEAESGRLGADTLVTRLTDLLVLQVIREHLASLDASSLQSPSWLAALSEPQIGAALALLHERAGEVWTVASLAKQVGMSRSAFAARFVRLVGEPPLHYLTRVRMQKAAALLRDSWDSTAQIAERVGYVSDTAFCKAFKRAFGKSPGAYRRHAKPASSSIAA